MSKTGFDVTKRVIYIMVLTWTNSRKCNTNCGSIWIEKFEFALVPILVVARNFFLSELGNSTDCRGYQISTISTAPK